MTSQIRPTCRPRVPAPRGVITGPQPQKTERDATVGASVTHGALLSSLTPISQTSTTTKRTLAEVQSNAESNARAETRLQNLPKEIADRIGDSLNLKDFGALYATSRQLEYKLRDTFAKRNFQDLRFDAWSDLSKVESIVSIGRLGSAIYSVTVCVPSSFGWLWESPAFDEQLRQLYLALQQAPNLTSLRIECRGQGSKRNFDFDLPAIALMNLKKLSLSNGNIDLESLLDFFKIHPKIEELHMEKMVVDDEELGTASPTFLELLHGVQPSREGSLLSDVMKAKTNLKTITTDDQSKRIVQER